MDIVEALLKGIALFYTYMIDRTVNVVTTFPGVLLIFLVLFRKQLCAILEKIKDWIIRKTPHGYDFGAAEDLAKLDQTGNFPAGLQTTDSNSTNNATAVETPTVPVPGNQPTNITADPTPPVQTPPGNADDANEQFKAGLAFWKGDGAEQNDSKAIEYWKKAAAKNHKRAQFYMGVAYDTGRGVERSPAEAVKWWEKAANQGHSTAQNNMGWAYRNGAGVEKNYIKAVEWWKKAAAQNDEQSQSNLGWAYYNGIGIEKDQVKAVQLWHEAAQNGSSTAQYNLGVAYSSGVGAEKDPLKAYMFYNLAAAEDEDARKRRDELEKTLTMEQILEAQKMTREWKEKHEGK